MKVLSVIISSLSITFAIKFEEEFETPKNRWTAVKCKDTYECPQIMQKVTERYTQICFPSTTYWVELNWKEYTPRPYRRHSVSLPRRTIKEFYDHFKKINVKNRIFKRGTDMLRRISMSDQRLPTHTIKFSVLAPKFINGDFPRLPCSKGDHYAASHAYCNLTQPISRIHDEVRTCFYALRDMSEYYRLREANLLKDNVRHWFSKIENTNLRNAFIFESAHYCHCQTK